MSDPFVFIDDGQPFQFFDDGEPFVWEQSDGGTLLTDLSGDGAVVIADVGVPGANGVNGVDGAAGPAGGVMQAVASAAVSAMRIVGINGSGQAFYVSSSLAIHAKYSLGVSLQAVATGVTFDIRTSGEISDASLSLTPQLPIYLGIAGQMIQTVPAQPTHVFSRKIGFAITATRMVVDIERAIALV